MRLSIDNLRRERLVFDNIYHKFERELIEHKKQMADIIETSNAAYEARYLSTYPVMKPNLKLLFYGKRLKKNSKVTYKKLKKSIVSWNKIVD
jgi:hypothetical protein